jgi:hypothetical protein
MDGAATPLGVSFLCRRGVGIRVVGSVRPRDCRRVRPLAHRSFGTQPCYIAERAGRRSWSYYFFAAAAANALLVIGTMVIRVEGLICAVLAVPLFSLVGGLGGLLMGAVCRWTKWPQRAIYSFAALLLLLGGLEQNLMLPQDIRSAVRVRTISASPEVIWTHLTVAKDIRPAEIGTAWMYRIGVPLPLDFPRRSYLTPRCVVRDSDEVYAWLDARKQLDQQTKIGRAPVPNIHSRKRHPRKSSL